MLLGKAVWFWGDQLVRWLKAWGWRGASLLLLCFGVVFGCSDASLPAPQDVAFVKGPPSQVPSPTEGCPDYDASALPPDLVGSGAQTAVAGTIAGSFSVSSEGSPVYAMRLDLMSGRAAMRPHLGVIYEGGLEEGILGVGFRLSGLSAVSRCPKNVAQDGEIRAIRDDAFDATCLDVARPARQAGPDARHARYGHRPALPARRGAAARARDARRF